MPRPAGCWTTTCTPPLAADRHFASWTSTSSRPRPGRPPAHAPDLSALEQAAAWLEAERANLHAAADYAAGRGRSSHAIAIPAAMSGFLASHGHWDQAAALHQTALTAARQAGDRLGEAHALAELGILQRETGDYPAAAASLALAVALFHDLEDLSGEADALNRLGFLRVLTGDYPAAAASHEQALALARRASKRSTEADALLGLGLLQQLTGGLPGCCRQSLPGPDTVPRPRRPARPGLRPQQPQRCTARDRGLRGCCRQPAAGPGAVP